MQHSDDIIIFEGHKQDMSPFCRKGSMEPIIYICFDKDEGGAEFLKLPKF